MNHRQKTISLLALALLFLVSPVFVALAQAQDAESRSFVPGRLIGSTYLGGSGEDGSWPRNFMAQDTEGNLYVAGKTRSTNFPTTPGAYDTERSGLSDVFISKFNHDLTELLASTYLGGSANESASCLRLDDSGNVYVLGITSSQDFPVTAGAYDSTLDGTWDFFVARLDPDLTSLQAATYIGGGANESEAHSFELDSSNNVIFCGLTKSSDYPVTAGAFDETFNDPGNPTGDGVISKLDGDLTSLLASTYLGGQGLEIQIRMTLDDQGDLFVTGATDSTDFPVTAGAYQVTPNTSLEMYITRMSPDLTTVEASTFVGGSDWDWGYSLFTTSSGDVYVTGHASADFPTTPGAYDRTYHGGPEPSSDVIVCRMDRDLTTLLASTFLGGAGFENGISIAEDDLGHICVGGYTNSSDFPSTPGAFDETQNGNHDAFVSVFDPDLSTLLHSTFVGGSGQDRESMAYIDANGSVYVTSNTLSTNAPMTGDACFPNKSNGKDIFITLLLLDCLRADTGELSAGGGGEIAFSIDAKSRNSGRTYLLLGSASGTTPGHALPGGMATLPIVWDALTSGLLLFVNTPVCASFFGTLDGLGLAEADLKPGVIDPVFVGAELHFACCLRGPFDFASNPVRIEIVP